MVLAVLLWGLALVVLVGCGQHAKADGRQSASADSPRADGYPRCRFSRPQIGHRPTCRR